MAKDFAKRSKPRKKTQPKARFSLGSYMAGVITGVGLFLLGAYGPEMFGIDDNQTALAKEAPASGTPAQKDEGASAEAPSAEEKPQDLEFEFRDLLGTDRVEPDVSAYETGAMTPPAQRGMPAQSRASAQGPMQYLLQSGSFQIKADAESRRGSLLLLNMPANIVEAELDSKIWYRVIVGPYTERNKAQQAAMRMRSEKIQSIWMERPISSG